MREIIRVFIFSSIGRKAVMALTGLGAIGFLFPHLGGNITIVGGEGYFNAYAHHLHSFPLLPLFEAGLAGMFLIHICYGVALTYMNWKARPIGYGMEQNAGGRTLSSGTMIYSGLVILTFILYHLWTVKLNPAIQGREAFDRVTGVLTNLVGAVVYMVGFGALALHLTHGAQSTLQSLGLRHPKYDPIIEGLGRVCAWVVSMGFAAILIWVYVKEGGR